MSEELAQKIYNSMSEAARQRTSIGNIMDVLAALSDWDDVINIIHAAYFGG